MSESKSESKSNVVTITDGNFKTEVTESKIPVLVDFWAEWCGPCVQLGPVLEEVAAERQGKIKICKVDVEANPTLASQYGIRNIPFMLLIKDGKAVGNLVGNLPKKTILEALDKL